MARINIMLDMSKYDTFLLCPERYNYRYNLNKELPQKAKPLDRGSLIHVANEFYYEGLKRGQKYEERVQTALSKMRMAFAIESDMSHEDFNHIVDTMEEYYEFWRYKDESLVIKEVERPFIKVIHEDDEVRIALSGKIDLFLEESRDEYPMDHKSMDRNRDVVRLNNQFRCYCLATDSYKIIVNKIGMQKTLKAHEKFLRVPITYDSIMLEEFRQNVVYNIMNTYLECVATGIWPLNETSCDKFNRKCDYLEVCESSGKEAKFFKLTNNYKDAEPWDVTKTLRKASAILEKADAKSE